MQAKLSLLLITYYWPPAGGAGVQRWLKMTRYLAEMGCSVTVITVAPEYASYPQRDETLQHDVDSRIRVIRTKSFEILKIYQQLFSRSEAPYGGFANTNKGSVFQRLAMFIRANFFLPDARKGWVPYALKAAKAELAENTYDWIISTGPPHSAHLCALKIKQLYPQIKWACDMRDPWTDIFYYHEMNRSAWAKRKDLITEQSVLSNADQIFTVSSGLSAIIRKKVINKPVHEIYNGFDEEDFKLPFNRIQDNSSAQLKVGYMGTMSSLYQPEEIWKAFNYLLVYKHFDSLEFRVCGKISESIEEELKNQQFQYTPIGYLPHNQALREMAGCHILLLVIPNTEDAGLILTGKVFEYLALQKPILAIGPNGGDLDTFLMEANQGPAVPRNSAVIADRIVQSVQSSKELKCPERLSRRNQTQALIAHLQ